MGRVGAGRWGEARNAALCAAAVVGAVLLAWPVCDLSFNDDWSYAFTVKRLAETGRVIYNGWSSPAVLAHAGWGLIWVKFWGFSFDVLRFSTLPLAAGSAALCYALARRAGLRASAAVFAALLTGLSPLFLPLAASFMTDVPALFFILLALYGLTRAADAAAAPRAAVGWLALGAVAGMVGGSSRQIVWAVPLAVVPYVACVRWRGRGDRRFVAASAVAWVSVFAVAWAIQSWLNRQPYAIPEPSMLALASLAARHPLRVATRFALIVLTTLLLLLPVAIGVLHGLRGRRMAVAALILAIVGPALWLHPYYALGPWMENTLTPAGVLGTAERGRPVVLTVPVRAALSAGVFLVAAAVLASALLWMSRPRRAWDEMKAFFLRPSSSAAAAAEPVVAQSMLLLCAGYLALLLTRCALNASYDRHVLPLIPCLAIPLLAHRQRRGGGAGASPAAWALLGVFALYAVASTQDVMSLARARVAAAQRLRDAGIPRARIDAGFEYNLWTELETTGYVNDRRIRNPPGAYRPGLGRTPSYHPLYRIESQPTPNTAPTAFGAVPYTSYLPPFRREVFIRRYVDDPAPASPAPLTARRPPIPTDRRAGG
jgi:hypothetical protein